MQLHFTFKNFEPSDHLRQYATTRFEKLVKYANTQNSEIHINLSVEKFRHMAEIILQGDGLNVSANEESEDMYSTIDLVLDKMDAQLRKIREKARDRRRDRGSVRLDMVYFEEGQAGGGPVIEESDSYDPKPMGVEEAAMQLDSLGYDFLVFYNADAERINVIYHRRHGVYGLIDPGLSSGVPGI